MEDCLEIQPVGGPIDGCIRPPGSKSLTNRALLIAALAHGRSVLRGVLESDDTRVMRDSLQKLGIAADYHRDTDTMLVDGCGGTFKQAEGTLFVNNSGTTIRFLTAALAMAGGRYVLDGAPRMRERPIGPLVRALQSIGATISTGSENECPPVSIASPRLVGGAIQIRGSISSQYLSGLLMAAPLASGDVRIEIVGPLVSKPYVSMTLEVMKRFGVEVESTEGHKRFHIRHRQTYAGCEFRIEPDASAASYYWAAAAICGGRAKVMGLQQSSLQGDVRFVERLAQMGCQVDYQADAITVTGPARRGIDTDMSDVSDTVQTLAAVSLFVDGPTRVRNVAHNRVKETDRIGNLAIELRKFGAEVFEFEDGLEIRPRPLHAATIDTYDDHRMAMSLSLPGLRQAGVVINDPGCVSKTYPNFFRDLQAFVEH
jgi:3-phosphoshikimate 1-carboxyvinyltransferase